LTLHWDAPRTISEVRIVFDSDLDMPHPTADPVDYLVKSYTVAVRTPSGWQPVVEEADNRARFRIHGFSPCETNAVKITVTGVHADGKSARIFEVRCY
jgi:hypothetical protein